MPVVHLNSYRLIRYAWQIIASNVQLEWLVFLEEIMDHSKCNLHNYENITAELLPDNRSSIAAITLSCFWVWSYFALNLVICGPCGSSNILLSGHLPSPVFIHTLASVVTTRKWVELDDQTLVIVMIWEPLHPFIETVGSLFTVNYYVLTKSGNTCIFCNLEN